MELSVVGRSYSGKNALSRRDIGKFSAMGMQDVRRQCQAPSGDWCK
jgi:hypothetical protein